MVTFVLMDSWIWYKSQDRLLDEKRPTFKAHISTRWEVVASEWLLENVLQGINGDLGILIFVFGPVIDLCDEIVEFGENRHNRNCSLSASDKTLDILVELTIPGAFLVEELHF